MDLFVLFPSLRLYALFPKIKVKHNLQVKQMFYLSYIMYLQTQCQWMFHQFYIKILC